MIVVVRQLSEDVYVVTDLPSDLDIQGADALRRRFVEDVPSLEIFAGIARLIARVFGRPMRLLLSASHSLHGWKYGSNSRLATKP